MLDFMIVSTRSMKRGTIEIYPRFIIKKSQDLMIRGSDFYAVWCEEKGIWSTDEQVAIDMIDKELDRYYEEHKEKLDGHVKVLHLWDSETGMIDRWIKYTRKQLSDSYHELDEKLVFSNSEIRKKDYASRRLEYPLEKGEFKSYDKLISTLYSIEERAKIEWAIGAIVSGDSKKIQKFLVFYGSAGTGKSTILNVIQMLFEGYYSVFDAKALGSSSNVFALEAFKSNPLVAIQHDGDLSRIEDNTRLNSLVSHEMMTVNEKFKSTYTTRFKAFLLIGTNKPVKITDAKSGLLRRLIDVSPSGNKLSTKEYNAIMKTIPFELGHIAQHCLDVYLDDPHKYDNYKPISMMGASNDFFNFVSDSYFIFKREDGVTLKVAWKMYQEYCEDANTFAVSRRVFQEELKNYFDDFLDRYTMDDGTRVRSYYSGFKASIFDGEEENKKSVDQESTYLIDFDSTESILDKMYADCRAQYANSKGTPAKKWDEVTTTLKDLDTSKLHYLMPPDESHIFIDFDLKDEQGNKSFELNLKAASEWPKTYAELSKSGSGIHLHYIYKGDVTKLKPIFAKDIEIKVCKGNSSLRRQLSKCNRLPIATISSGLPLKEEKEMINKDVVKNEKGLRRLIDKALHKEIHDSTKPNVDFISKILNDAYDSGMIYDVSDMKDVIIAFAANSSHQADICLKIVTKMPFKSDEFAVPEFDPDDGDIVFYDIEVFPNLLLVNWKLRGPGNPVIRMINPTPDQIENLLKMKLVGFNCRRYDNHILYGRLLGYDNEQIYKLSKRIIDGSREAFFGEAYNASYTDVYDFASAANKKSLKKLEIDIMKDTKFLEAHPEFKRVRHHELGLDWDKPVPEELWPKVSEYCDDDVIATEAAFTYLAADWTARRILASLAGKNVNETTNNLTTAIIFGNNKKPQNEFNYRNLSEPVTHLDEETYDFLSELFPDMMSHTHGEAGSLLPYFPGYEFNMGKSTYKEFNPLNPNPEYRCVGEGGLAYSKPGVWSWLALLDVTSMHPHSTMAECLFGVRYTKAYRDIVYGRVNIKHEAWDLVNNMLEGRLTPFIQDVLNGKLTSGELADALKTAINSVYGLTSARFTNPFKDSNNIDNIVAKRGALFMVDLKEAVERMGFTVVHIKTDSIKIPNATSEIIDFVMEFGKRYGYFFEHEATYERMCIINKAEYIARYATAEECIERYGYAPKKNEKSGGKWTATGDAFKEPYIFKKLFSHEEINFYDLCQTFSVTSSLYLDMNENLPDVTKYEKELDKAKTQFRKGLISDTIFEGIKERLEPEIAKGHDYKFVGRVGLFCPVKDGVGGGILLRASDKGYGAANDSKGYRWLEADLVKDNGSIDDINFEYYDEKVKDAMNKIVVYGDFERFISDIPYPEPDFVQGEGMSYPVYKEILPFD